ncbi:MAG TPA: aminopeptidase [Gammaproteobacteria bacterium]|nr:aminopeptidase [Gammaproteobacteria bacterium]
MRRRFRILLLIPVCAAVNSCATPFYWQAIGGEIEMLRKRTPIDEVLADPSQSDRVKSALSSVTSIRSFAVHTLGLPDNDSYTTYADLGRPYVVWNVVATPEFSIVPKHWCFPFAGCVSYRGFFDEDKARHYQRALEKAGLDTYMGGSTAYSTLGYFKDPILNTMIDGGEIYIASVLFHELAHQRLYVKSDSAFSEAFAMTVEEYGTQRWLEAKGDTKGLDRYRKRLHYRSQFSELVAKQQRRLREVFAQPISADEKRREKAEAYAQMRDDYRVLKASWGGASDYDGWFDQPLNNATLAAVATYRRWLPVLKARLERLGVEGFYREMERLASMNNAQRQLVLQAWDSEESPADVLARS